MDGPTITLIIGIIGCVIGVSTFVSSLLKKAQTNGVLEQALQGIDEIKTQVKDSAASQSNMSLTVQSHTEQIKNLYKALDELKARVKTVENIDTTLGKILDAIKALNKEDQV